MRITVYRDTKTSNSVTSLIQIDGVTMFAGLEPPNPIPAGTYEVWIRWSAHNKRWVLGVMDVPGHTDIEVHMGNSAADTRDCLLIGRGRTIDYINSSKDAFVHLLAMAVQCVSDDEPITITYNEHFEEPHATTA